MAAQASQLLAAGGSRSPADLERSSAFGLVADPGIWESGLALVGRRWRRPEAAAEDDLAAADDAA